MTQPPRCDGPPISPCSSQVQYLQRDILMSMNFF